MPLAALDQPLHRLRIVLGDVPTLHVAPRTAKLHGQTAQTRRVLRDVYFEKNLRDSVTDADAKTFYDAQVASAKPTMEVHARHILVETQEQASDIREKLARGAEFEELAKAESKDPGSAANGGDLGFFGEGDMVELVVEDTGCGMTREQLARIWEPFFTTKADGHGLGLAICRSIVAQMRGHFSIESTPGSGTRVRASFPVREEGGP